MKNKITILLLLIFITACESVKIAQKSVNSGNYDNAIKIAVNQLRKDKIKESNQPYIQVLSDAFQRATERDLNQIEFLIKDGNPRMLKRIYDLYVRLKNRQNLIQPLTPLINTITGKVAVFNFKNYDNDIIKYKNKYSEDVYQNAKKLFLNNTKLAYRKAHREFTYLNEFNYAYKDVQNLLNEAHNKGTDYVLVVINNDIEQIIPEKLENDLLNFDTYGLNDFWTVFHGFENPKIAYSFNIELNVVAIQVSPEKIKEKEYIFEKQVVNGFTFAVNEKGEEILDRNGKKIKVDTFVNTRCKLNKIRQTKSVLVAGQVKFTDHVTKEILQVFPLDCEYVFEHIFANYRGDTRALADDFYRLTKQKRIPFPSNEQMVFDAGDDLKNQLKEIIMKSSFRN